MSKMKPTEKDKQSSSIKLFATSLLMTRDTIPHVQIAYIVVWRSLIKEMVITMIMITHVKYEIHRER